MTTPDRRNGYDGLSQVAHAIRRSTALTVAMQMTDPVDGTIEDMLVLADRLSVWILGAAGQEELRKERPERLGKGIDDD